MGELLFRAYFPGRVIQESRVPPTGPAILVANHSSALDGVLIHAVCRRPLRALVAVEWVESRLLRMVFWVIGAIPVDRVRRNPDALEAAVRALERGEAVALFPEGGIHEGHGLGPFRNGASRLALRTGAPVFPCAIIGTFEALPWPKILPRRRPITIRCGVPMQFPAVPDARPPGEALARATDQIRQAVERLVSLGHSNGRSGGPESSSSG